MHLDLMDTQDQKVSVEIPVCLDMELDLKESQDILELKVQLVDLVLKDLRVKMELLAK